MTVEQILADPRCLLLRADAIDALALLRDDSIDSVVTDPPAGISFMGKAWDGDKGGRDQWVAWLAAILRECLRVLKPGAHALVWSIPRTSHWTALALESAGFEVRDVVYHGFGSGFPKSLDVSKAIDAHLGASDARPVIGKVEAPNGQTGGLTMNGGWQDAPDRTSAATAAAAAAWDGWGTALKPAAEHWILARKPLDGTYAENLLKWGVGAINVDGCRIGEAGGGVACENRDATGKCQGHANAGQSTSGETFHGPRPAEPVGRWPANVVLSHDERCVAIGEEEEKRSLLEHTGRTGAIYGAGLEGSRQIGTATLRREVFACVPGCPVRMLDDATGDRTGSNGRKGGKRTTVGLKHDSEGTTTDVAASKGGASRFYYVAKPSRREKDAGLDHLPKRSGGEATGRADGSDGLKSPRAGGGRGGGAANFHPTPKGIDLMRWLVRLITPSGGTVLDPFAGSGTTGVATLAEGAQFIGVERDLDEAGESLGYAAIAEGRLRHALAEHPTPAPRSGTGG